MPDSPKVLVIFDAGDQFVRLEWLSRLQAPSRPRAVFTGMTAHEGRRSAFKTTRKARDRQARRYFVRGENEP